jgi:hypothetical protein
MAHDQEVMGSNPGTVYWMDGCDLLAIKLKKIENKGSQMGRPKKIFLQKVITSLFYILYISSSQPGLCLHWGFSSQGYAKSLKTTQKYLIWE